MSTLELATYIADHLEGWKVQEVAPNERRVGGTFLTYDHGRVKVRVGRPSSIKLRFAPEWPTDNHGLEHRPSGNDLDEEITPVDPINVSVGSEFKRMANDIKRRLLDRLPEIYLKQLEKCQEYNAAYAKQQEVADELANILCCKAVDSNGDKRPEFHPRSCIRKVSVLHNGENVTLEFNHSIPASAAKEICKIVSFIES